MNLVRTFVFLCAIMLSVVVGAAPDKETARDTIRFATVDFPPYSYMEGGRIEGIEVDIVRRVCELAGVGYEMELLPFKRAYESVLDYKNTGVDAIFNFYKNPERLTLFDYSDPILENPLVFFARKESPVVFDGDLASVKGNKIGIMIGYTYSPEFTKAIQDKSILFEETTSHEANFRKLEAHRIDLYPVEKFVGVSVARKYKVYDSLRVLEKPLIVQQGYVGFAKGNPKAKLLEKLNSALKKLRSSGEYERIFDRHLTR